MRFIRRVRATAKDHELRETAQVVDAPPGVEFAQVVRADEVVEPRAGEFGGDALDGVDAEARARALEFRVIEDKARLISERGGEHGAAQRGGRGRARELVRRVRGGNEDHPVQRELLQRLAREDEMPVVDWVESAAVEREVHLPGRMREERARTPARR